MKMTVVLPFVAPQVGHFKDESPKPHLPSSCLGFRGHYKDVYLHLICTHVVGVTYLRLKPCTIAKALRLKHG